MNSRLFGRSRNVTVQVEHTVAGEATTPLEVLTEGDRSLAEALSNYLLLDPERQTVELGPAESHSENGMKYKEKGNYDSARWEFELAARIAISNMNMEKVKEYLMLAASVSASSDHMKHHQMILEHLDKVREIVARYYRGKKYRNASE